jgi:hypothetical protein
VALSSFKSEDTSTGPIQRRTQLLSVTLELVQTPSSRPSFSCLEGRDEAVWLKKPVWSRNNVRTSTNHSFHSSNITIVGAYLSPHAQLTPISAQECRETRGEAGQGAYSLCAHPQQCFARFASIIDAQASCHCQAGIVVLVMMVLLALMHRRLCRCRNGVVALVTMTSLPLPMRRHLAVVNNDGKGVTSNKDDNVNNDGATGNGDNNNRDSAMDDKVDNDDGNGVTDDNIDNDCNGAMGDVDYDHCNGATDHNVNNDGDSATDVNIDGNCTGATDNEVDDDGDGATGGRHCLDARGGCALKDDAWWRDATTGNATTTATMVMAQRTRTSMMIAMARQTTKSTMMVTAQRAVAIVWTHEVAAQRKMTHGGGMQQQAARHNGAGAGKREDKGRRGASGQEATGPQ